MLSRRRCPLQLEAAPRVGQRGGRPDQSCRGPRPAVQAPHHPRDRSPRRVGVAPQPVHPGGEPRGAGQREGALHAAGGDRRTIGGRVPVRGPLIPDQHVRCRVAPHPHLFGRDLDAPHPLHAGRPDPAGHHRTHRESVVRRERRAVHGQGQDRVRVHGLCDRHGAGPRRVIHPDDVHVHGVVTDSGEGEHIGQARAAPLRAPDGSGSPLAAGRGPSRDRLEEPPPVAGAFDVRDEGLAGERPQFVEAQLDLRLGPRSAHRQHEGRGVDGGRARVVADEEQLVRGDQAAQVLQTGFQVGAVLDEGSGILGPNRHVGARVGARTRGTRTRHGISPGTAGTRPGSGLAGPPRPARCHAHASGNDRERFSSAQGVAFHAAQIRWREGSRQCVHIICT